MSARAHLDECPELDHRLRPRRRGEVLLDAILQATIDELTEVGYSELTMESVATRARASKGSLYRRWPSRADLVADAVRHIIPRFVTPPDDGDLRHQMLGVLRGCAGEMQGPSGQAARGLIAEAVRNPDLLQVIRTQVGEMVFTPMLEVLRRGVVRGDVRPAALTPRVAAVGPDLLFLHHLLHSDEIGDEVLVEIVDDVLLPLVRPI